MSDLTLVIGSKTYSSWSLRPWLFMRFHNVPFKEVTVTLNQPDTKKKLFEHSPSGRVPVLKHGGVRVWESLAICEYVAENFKLPNAWPAEPGPRAHARSLSFEMHAGFADLRRELPMDARRAPAAQAFSPAVATDVARIRTIWRDCRQANAKNGEWLFGKFGIVDAMYAPVALRFHTYGVSLDGPEKEYLHSALNLPALREWLGAAMLESGQAPAAAAAAPAPAATPPPPQAAAPQAAAPPAATPPPSAPGASMRPQVVSNDGGVRVVSHIIPD
jgi:glutathione S-transferase